MVVLMDKVGVVYGDTSISECQILCDKKIRFGEFVLLKNIDDIDVLGTVKNIKAMDDKLLGGVSIVGALNGHNLFPNRSPIKPNSEALLGDDSILARLYYDNKGLNVGHLLTRDSVRVYLNTNKLISRHFAVLAVTGGGKSNTIAVLCRELAKINSTAVIMDPHGEYMSMRHEDMEGKLNPMPAKLDPSIMSSSEFADLIGLKEDSRKERIFLNMAFHTIKQKEKEEYKEYRGKRFVETVRDLISEWVNNSVVGWEVKYYNHIKNKYDNRKLDKEDTDILLTVLDTIANFESGFSANITEGDIIENFQRGKLNIIDLSGFEVNQMIALVSYIAKQLLTKRILYAKSKRDLYHHDEKIRSSARNTAYQLESKFPALTKPIVMIVEEAHIYIPKNKETDASYWLGKIAREGRKFGVGLGIITQQPKKLNEDVLSQTNTKVILRIVEPEDQKYIQKASEDLGEDLVKDLASLGIGEAVITGTAIKLPAIVKIDRFDGAYGGEDINIYEEWNE